jgi:quinoprotein dehydrogenase-associated probable ABC transporter substrate-binding protein
VNRIRTWLYPASFSLVFLLVAALAYAQGANTGNTGGHPTLRVCADPDNLPFSDREEQGFENKIASLVAEDLGMTVSYFWWPHRRGFLRNTLRAGECDVLMGVPEGMDAFITTKPYYRSTFQFVSRVDRDLDITSFDDPRLRKLKIGVNMIGYEYNNSPAARALGVRGIVGLKGFPTFYNEENRPSGIIAAVAEGEIDLAIVWGPVAGYFAKQQEVPLALSPVPEFDPRSRTPFAFGFAVGVRKPEKALLARIQQALDRKRGEIEAVLHEYGIPIAASEPRVLPDAGQPAGAMKEAAASGADAGTAVAQAQSGDKLLASADEYQGWKWFHVYCFRCHGIDAMGSDLAPNLRNSVSPQGLVTHDVFLQTVREGRPDKGMQSWKALLDDSQIEQLYLYVKARSEGRLAPGRPHRATASSK